MGNSNTTQWTNELIKEKLIEVKDSLKLDRMPSRSEVEYFYRNTSLTNAVTRHGGWYVWAERLGFEIKESETGLGKQHEKEVEETLLSSGYEVRRMPQNFPYDLLVNDCVKVDVKASKLYKGKAGSFYSFNLEKPFSTCDIYVLRLLDDDGEAIKSLVVPSKFVATQTQIGVGENSSKYYKFDGRWDYLESYCSFCESVV